MPFKFREECQSDKYSGENVYADLGLYIHVCAPPCVPVRLWVGARERREYGTCRKRSISPVSKKTSLTLVMP